MAKKTRITMIPFAESATTSTVGVFGSKYSASPATSKDPTVIQSLANWGLGLISAVIGVRTPCLEDLNGIFLVFSYMLCYLMETGMPEYDAATNYCQNAYCQVSGVLYCSLVTDNIGNTPASSPTKWVAVIDTDVTMAANSDTVVPSQKAVAAYVTGRAPQISILTGTVAHGGTIPLPAGYTEVQCKWMVSPSDMHGWSDGGGGIAADMQIQCSAIGTRAVTCQARVLDNGGGWQAWYAGTANYMIIGTK